MARVVDEDPMMYKRCGCRGCAARVEYTQNEVKTYHGTDISGGPAGYEWINCPRCGREIILRSW